MNKQQAAEYLGISLRAIDRYTSSGKLASRTKPGKSGQPMTFEETELERFKAELEASASKGATKSGKHQHDSPSTSGTQSTSEAGTNPVVAPEIDGADPINRAVLLRAVYELANLGTHKGRHAASVPVEAKLLLTLDEAHALTGLSRNALREAIDSGVLKAARIGRSWRVKRADLEHYIKSL